MYSFALAALLVGAGPVATSPQGGPPAKAESASPSDLTGALQEGNVAEVYVINPSISYAAAPTPATVRSDGCRYLIHRGHYLGDSPEWRELTRALAGMAITLAPAARRRQVRLGLVVGDERGTIREIYADSLAHPPGKVFAFDERRQVHISERFSAALLAFAARHPELAQGPTERCPALEVP